MINRDKWSEILNYIDITGKEIGTFTIINRTKSYFLVRVDGDNLVVSNSKILKPSCMINVNRIINYKQFKEIYNLFDSYINKEKGIREKMCKLNNNSTYIISIIHSVINNNCNNSNIYENV